MENDRLRTELACEKVLRNGAEERGMMMLRAKNHWRDRLLVYAERAVPIAASTSRVAEAAMDCGGLPAWWSVEREAESVLLSDLAAEAGPGARVLPPATPPDGLVRITVADAEACLRLAMGSRQASQIARAGGDSVAGAFFGDLVQRIGDAIEAWPRVGPEAGR